MTDSTTQIAAKFVGGGPGGTYFDINHSGQDWYWYCKAGVACGIYSVNANLQLIQMKVVGNGVADVKADLFETTPVTPAGSAGCAANTMWADDNYLYHCNSAGTYLKRVPFTAF
jgi:hypothetical protein